MSDTYYLAGKMSGLPDFGYAKFGAAAWNLRQLCGITIKSPHETYFGEPIGQLGTLPYREYVKAGLVLLFRCDRIVLLPDWADSTGARLELNVALTLGMGVHYYLDSAPFLSQEGLHDVDRTEIGLHRWPL